MTEEATPAKVRLSAGLGGTLPEAYPPPHAKYLLERDGITFTATPCYGMHAPWWVVRTLVGEAEPEPMRDGDRWAPVTPNDKLSGQQQPVRRLACMVAGHKYRVARQMNHGARKVVCDRCGGAWGMHDATRAFVPWDAELEAAYAPGGPLDPAHYKG